MQNLDVQFEVLPGSGLCSLNLTLRCYLRYLVRVAFSMPVRETKIDLHRGSLLVRSLFSLPTFFLTHTRDLFTEISQNVRGAGWGEMLQRGIEATGFVVY